MHLQKCLTFGVHIKIDLDFMNDFISAIIKLAIKDVVIYADRKIKATKDVVNMPREDDVE